MVKKYFCFCSLPEHFEFGCLIFQECFVSKTKLSPKTNIVPVISDMDVEKKHLSKYSVVLNLEC